jgi:hypothetical protein
VSDHATATRRTSSTLAALIAVAGAVLMLAFVATGDGHAADGHSHNDTAVAGSATHKQGVFQDAMRKLWEDHITWTRLAIISFAHDLPDLPATQSRLLKNQEDIGNAIKPYYGKAAGNRLTALLKDHIVGAVALLQAAKSGDQALINQRTDEWYLNGNEIADFLAKANPRNWRQQAMRRMMKRHLDQTLNEAVNRLGGKYNADVRDYDKIHRHILRMADTLSKGIIKQFPGRFR